MTLHHMGAQCSLEPDTNEMLVETLWLPIEELPPKYEAHCGWRIMSGNERFNSWARVVYRYEIEEDFLPEPAKDMEASIQNAGDLL